MIVLVLVLLVFGVGWIGNIAGEMGSGIRAFREGLRGNDAGGHVQEDAKVKEI